MAAKCLLRVGQSHVSMNTTVENVTVDANEIRWSPCNFCVNVLGRKSAVADGVHVIVAYRSDSAQDDSVTDSVLLYEFFDSRQQISLVFKSKDVDPAKLARYGHRLRYVRAIRFLVVFGAGSFRHRGLRALSPNGAAYRGSGQYESDCEVLFHYSLPYLRIDAISMPTNIS